MFVRDVPYSGKLSRETEKFRENGEHTGFADKTFADSYNTPGMVACACDVREENFRERACIHEIRESFLPRKFPAIRYIPVYFIVEIHGKPLPKALFTLSNPV